MKKFFSRTLFLAAIVALIGCGKNTGTHDQNEEPAEAVSLHSLEVLYLPAPQRSVVSGMLHLPGQQRDVFYFTGPIDGHTTLTPPIGKDTLSPQCTNGSCDDFEFAVRWREFALQRKVKAHVWHVVSVDSHPDAVLNPPATSKYDTRLHWQTLLKSEVSLQQSTVIESHYGKARYLTAVIGGTRSDVPLFSISSPSEGGEGFVAFNYRLNDAGLFGAGHDRGEVSLSSNRARVRLSGGYLDLVLR